MDLNNNEKYKLNCLAFTEYKGKAREMVHLIKEGEEDKPIMNKVKFWDNLSLVGRYMSSMIPADSLLIPIPSHNGKAKTTLALAGSIAFYSNSLVFDGLQSEKRESSYLMKKTIGKPLKAEEIKFQLKYPVPEELKNRPIFFVDNVIASGNTAAAALKLIPNAKVVAMAIDLNATERRDDINWMNHITNMCIMKNYSGLNEEYRVRYKMNDEQMPWKTISKKTEETIKKFDDKELQKMEILYNINISHDVFHYFKCTGLKL